MRLCIIGCGAVTKKGHLPAAENAENVDVTLLVDKNRARAEELAHQFNVSNVAEDYRQAWKTADAAIVALPHNLHASVSADLLGHGTHVLVEKPMALTVDECNAMIHAAEQSGTVLSVGLMRRFRWSAQFAKAIFDMHVLGAIQSFDIREGFVYNWPVASDFFFKKETAGGGVLMDAGSHTLDSLLWWLGDVASFEYYDDSYGGVEADCELRLRMKSGARGIVELSRTRNLRNTAVISGERGEIEVGIHNNQVRFLSREAGLAVVGTVLSERQQLPGEQSLVDLLAGQLADWVRAIRGECTAKVSGVEGRRSIALIESCYARRKPLVLPWMQTDGNQDDELRE